MGKGFEGPDLEEGGFLDGLDEVSWMGKKSRR